jgi:hypothetical protein
MTRLIAAVVMAALASATSIQAATSTAVSVTAEEKFAIVSAKAFCLVWEKRHEIAENARKAKIALDKAAVLAKKHRAAAKRRHAARMRAIRKHRNHVKSQKRKAKKCKRRCRGWRKWRCRNKCHWRYKYWAQTSAEDLSTKGPSEKDIKMMQGVAKLVLKNPVLKRKVGHVKTITKFITEAHGGKKHQVDEVLDFVCAVVGLV